MTRGKNLDARELLRDAGLDVEVGRFAELLREAVRIVGTASASEPASQLSEAEVSDLRSAGLHADAGLGPYERVRAATVAQMAVLLASTLTVAEAADRLGLDLSRVRQMLSDRSLIASNDGWEWRILDLQFAGDRLVPNITDVAPAFPEGMPLLAIANWLTMPEADLEVAGSPVSPLEWLSGGGDPERVAHLASDL